MESKKEVWLAGEHLIQDLTCYSSQKEVSQITLSNLQEIRKYPFSNLSNLSLGENLDQIAHELRTLPISHVVELSTRFHGLKVERLKELQERSGKQILFGWTPKENYLQRKYDGSLDQEKLIGNELKFYMKHGEQGMLPAFIGELIISDVRDIFEKSMLRAVQQFTDEENCPVYINVGRQLALFKDVVEIFKLTQAKNVIFVLEADQLLESDLQLKSEVKTLLDQTEAKICLTVYSHHLLPDFQSKVDSNKHQKIEALKFMINAYSQRIFISNNCTFKTHLKLFGGKGYGQILDLLADIGISSMHRDKILHDNPKMLTTWRKVEVKQEAPVKKWECSFCHNFFAEGSIEKIEKLDFQYCSMKCLSSHRAKNFA